MSYLIGLFHIHSSISKKFDEYYRLLLQYLGTVTQRITLHTPCPRWHCRMSDQPWSRSPEIKTRKEWSWHVITLTHGLPTSWENQLMIVTRNTNSLCVVHSHIFITRRPSNHDLMTSFNITVLVRVCPDSSTGCSWKKSHDIKTNEISIVEQLSDPQPSHGTHVPRSSWNTPLTTTREVVSWATHQRMSEKHGFNAYSKWVQSNKCMLVVCTSIQYIY